MENELGSQDVRDERGKKARRAYFIRIRQASYRLLAEEAQNKNKM